MSNGVVEEQQAIFKSPCPRMMYHLKPLFIRENMDNIVVNKVIIDRGTNVNLMSCLLFKKMGKKDANLQPYNMVLSNCEGKTRFSVGSATRTTLFMVITSNATYKLLFGCEWIHDICAVSYNLHQRVSVCREDGIVENIEAYQICYMDEFSKVGKKNLTETWRRFCHVM